MLPVYYRFQNKLLNLRLLLVISFIFGKKNRKRENDGVITEYIVVR